jgi:hypothetical protein
MTVRAAGSMTKRLTFPQKPSEQLASAPIVNPVASAITAVSFRAIAGRWHRHDAKHDVAAVVDVAVCRRASTTDTLLPLPSRHGAGRHRVQLSPAAPGRASPRTGESRSRRRRPPFAMTADLRGDGDGIVISRSRRAQNGVIVASICSSGTRYWPGTNIYAHFHADHAHH